MFKKYTIPGCIRNYGLFLLKAKPGQSLAGVF